MDKHHSIMYVHTIDSKPDVIRAVSNIVESH